MTKTVLVTGGAGFIGASLCRRLLDLDHNVICLDNFRTGQRSNVDELANTGRFTLLTQDVTDPINLEVDEIYNLACPASPVHYQHDPIETTRTCVLGAINVLELSARTGAVVFQASTSEVYGDPSVHPQTESYWGNVNPIGPRACYDEGKRLAETLFFDYQRQRGVDIRVGRIFNCYGPRMATGDGRVISNFVVQALRGEDITIYGDGRQTRSFCFVDDLVTGILKHVQSDLTGPVNLGNPEEVSMLELADLVLELSGSRSRLVHRAAPQDDPRQRRPDITLASGALGWTPATGLRDGLTRTIADFERRLAAAAP